MSPAAALPERLQRRFSLSVLLSPRCPGSTWISSPGIQVINQVVPRARSASRCVRSMLLSRSASPADKAARSSASPAAGRPGCSTGAAPAAAPASLCGGFGKTRSRKRHDLAQGRIGGCAMGDGHGFHKVFLKTRLDRSFDLLHVLYNALDLIARPLIQQGNTCAGTSGITG